MKKIIALSAVAFISANAASFQSIGYKSISMGGASVSNAKGDMAIYSNPALLGEKDDNFDTSAGGGIVIKDNGAGQSMSDLQDLDLTGLVDKANTDLSTITEEDLAKMIEAKDIMIGNDGSSLSVRPHAHFSVETLNFGIGVFNTAELGAKLNIDSTKSELIVWQDTNNNGLEDTNDIYTKLEDTSVDFQTLINSYNNSTMQEYQDTSIIKMIDSKDNNVQIQAVNITEVPVGYGELFPTKYGEFGLGASIKYIMGSTYSQIVDVDNTSAIENFSNDYQVTHTFGIDLGMTYKPNQNKNWVTGLVLKNINKPTFAMKDAADYELQPMARIGTSYKGEWYEVASDLDLTENETFNGPEKMVGGGVSVTPWNGTSLRAGLKKNLSDETGEMIYTAGLGLGMKWVSLDIAGEIGNKEVTLNKGTVNETTYRQHMGVAFNLISRF